MKNREERPTAWDRGASQQTFDFGDEVEPTLPANLLRQELTDPASIDTPSLSVSSETCLIEQVVDPRNLDRACRQVKSNRGAPGPDGMTIEAFESWCPEHWPAVKQQLLDWTYADDFVIFVRSERSAERMFASVQRYLTQHLKLVVKEQKSSVRPARGYTFTLAE